jgi:hypothetical protein
MEAIGPTGSQAWSWDFAASQTMQRERFKRKKKKNEIKEIGFNFLFTPCVVRHVLNGHRIGTSRKCVNDAGKEKQKI